MHMSDVMVEFNGKVLLAGGEVAETASEDNLLKLGDAAWMDLPWIISRGLWSFCTVMCLL